MLCYSLRQREPDGPVGEGIDIIGGLAVGDNKHLRLFVVFGYAAANTA